MTNLPQPHDRLFKALLSHPETAGALLREYLPAPIVALLTPDNPELVSETFVSQELRPVYSDRVFRSKTVTGKEVFFYTLMEHKSYLDQQVALQLGRGIMGIKEMVAKQDPDWTVLPAVLPFVLFHGAQEWTIPTEFLGVVDADPAFHPYLMNFSYILADLGPIPDSRLARDARLRAGLLALKYGTRDAKSQMAALENIIAALLEAPELIIPVVIYMLTTFPSVDQNKVHEIVLQVCPQEETKMLSIFAREIIDQNKQAWLQKGEQNGWMEAILELLGERFGVVPEWARLRVAEADLETLKRWSKKIFGAETIEHVFQ
ncbi:MAG: Rpn family recombination-promoting nuclease/putative transposase [Magnetococcales bacterium]|nr:Rpn family recombination-promoting nuclease/putative transposase [Magnetococcales bacterium]NGZ28879.1 Rpn family recombination-promoting nuclease/putative transposase [Magnetococcales bacterium]